jgi:tRNA(Ile)-lysidine synthase
LSRPLHFVSSLCNENGFIASLPGCNAFLTFNFQPATFNLYPAPVDSLISRVEQNVQQHMLFKAGQGILVAVSGGLDSMALLDLLHSMAAEAKWRLAVAHFNHRLRGRAADLDEALVRATTQKLGLPFAAGRADVRRLAKNTKISLEMAARQARHDFLARTARRFGLKTIALAHHANDQIELFFIRLLRGSGGEGLAGMKWQSPSAADSRVQLTRPLLNVSKQDLGEYAREHNLKFREDATNHSQDILRNRVRHELQPLLRKRYQSGLDKIILRVSELVSAEAEFASDAARAWLKSRPTRRTTFDRLPIAVQRRVVQMQVAELGVEPEFELVEKLRLKPNSTVSVQIVVEQEYSKRRHVRRKRTPLPNAPASHQIVRNPAGEIHFVENRAVEFNRGRSRHVLRGRSGSIVFEGLRVDWRLIERTGASRARGRLGHEWFDADVVGRHVLLRYWSEGDRFQPIGMTHSAKLQDFFINLKIPRDQRHQLVVAEAQNGQIFWVERLRISERFKLKPGTRRRLEWRWKRAGMRVAV